MAKLALFVFNGDPMCFIHVLLNALDMAVRKVDVRIVVEGSATKLIPELAQANHPLFALWQKVKAQGLVEGVCKACSQKMGTHAAVQEQGLVLLDEMNGHPSMARFHQQGYTVITF